MGDLPVPARLIIARVILGLALALEFSRTGCKAARHKPRIFVIHLPERTIFDGEDRVF